MKRHAPATLRNRGAIAAVLEKELPERGILLEIASGTGEHAAFFAGQFPAFDWQPSDPDHDAITSIHAYRDEYGGSNLLEPAVLDAASPNWAVRAADAILCINMVHISPWPATVGLFKGAARTLIGRNAPLILYGPYFEKGVDPAPSNIDFDRSLNARDERWGIRHVEELDQLAAGEGFTRTARIEMPANNLMLVYRVS